MLTPGDVVELAPQRLLRAAIAVRVLVIGGRPYVLELDPAGHPQVSPVLASLSDAFGALCEACISDRYVETFDASSGRGSWRPLDRSRVVDRRRLAAPARLANIGGINWRDNVAGYTAGMGRRRGTKRPTDKTAQLELPKLDKLDKNGQRRGGARPGAGRPCKDGRPGSPHTQRPIVKSYQPVHVVLRVASDLGSMRKRKLYDAFRWATLTAARREADEDVGTFKIVHLSIQQTHVHLLVEAEDKHALARGMQSFEISAAKHINRIVSGTRAKRRRGSVFPDRYHLEIIKTPTQARHTLAYVLNNWRKHREDQTPVARDWKLDPFSTAVLFPGWRELDESPWLWKWRVTYEPLCVYRPSTWLLREGWRKAGAISCFDAPGRQRAEASG